MYLFDFHILFLFKLTDNSEFVLQSMKEKKSDIAQFAVYAKQVFKYKKCTADYQQQVEYIKSLFEVSLD